MKPLVEQMIFFTPSVDLIVNCMKITLIKKKNYNGQICQSFLYYVYYQGFTVVLLG